MKQIKLAMIALFTLMTVGVSAQDSNNPWVVGFGVNAVDMRGGRAFENLVKDGELVCSLVFNTSKLKEIVKGMDTRTVMGGDNNASKLHLVSLKNLMKEFLK